MRPQVHQVRVMLPAPKNCCTHLKGNEKKNTWCDLEALFVPSSILRAEPSALREQLHGLLLPLRLLGIRCGQQAHRRRRPLRLRLT